MTVACDVPNPMAELAAQIIAERKPTPKNVYVYALLDADDNLLYVGQSSNVKRRLKQHEARQPWRSEIARCVTVAGPMERFEAQLQERLLIHEAQPIHNVYCTGRRLPPRGRHANKR